jgi:phage tail sheath protein FI
MDYKVPGVFIEEVQLFPPSVATVATGIPAFIGHTELVEDPKGNSLINKPIRISSLLEFRQLFGGAYIPAEYTVQVDPADFTIISVSTDNGFRYYLFDSVRHYFDNGGGPCYIVTVGDYTEDIIYGTDTTGLRGGLKSLEKADEPTILVSPDSVALLEDGDPDFVGAGTLHQDMIAQCAHLQDRVALLDLMEGYRALPTPMDEFRDAVGNQNLNYAAAYYPWLSTSYLRQVLFAQLSFEDLLEVPIPITAFNTMTGDTNVDGLLTGLTTRIEEESRIFGKVSTVTLDRTNYNPLLQHFQTLRQAVLDETTDADVRLAFIEMMNFVRQIALAFRDLENDAGNSIALTEALVALEANTTLQDQLADLISFEKNAGVMNSIDAARATTNVDIDYAILDTEDWIAGEQLINILSNGADYTNGGTNTVAQTAHASATSTELQEVFDVIADSFVLLVSSMIFLTDQAEKQLFSQHPFFKAVHDRVTKYMSLLPPSGAIAGVYASVDRTRGVWKAPANVSLRNVVAPAYKVTDQEQELMNIHTTGKSINAIRAFTGRGILVWGARTLAGNDNEWRYINVRRFFTFVEESTKKATEPFVFESNDANTWVKVRAMLENFLTLLWRQGALAGAKPEQAFFVKCGLGQTMTAVDILEGRLIVEIGMAAVRPAEFIILRFMHKLQES